MVIGSKMMLNILFIYSWLLTPAFMSFASDSERVILSMSQFYAVLDSLLKNQ